MGPCFGQRMGIMGRRITGELSSFSLVCSLLQVMTLKLASLRVRTERRFGISTTLRKMRRGAAARIVRLLRRRSTGMPMGLRTLAFLLGLGS